MNKPVPGSLWIDTETGELVEVESFDGAYAVVFGDHHNLGRGVTNSGKPNAFLVQRDHFGHRYVSQKS